MADAASLVDRLFARLQLRYGSAWSAMWTGIPLDAVKADWQQALERVSADSMAYALEHLPPERPPNVAQFKALCVRAPSRHAALPAPVSTNPAIREAGIQALKMARIGNTDPQAWIHALIARRNGDATRKPERLSFGQRDCLRNACQNLGLDEATGLPPA